MTDPKTPAHISDACIGELGVPRDRTCDDCLDADCEHECHGGPISITADEDDPDQ